jgi:hypothetical protein
MWTLGLLGAASIFRSEYELIGSALLASNQSSVTFDNLDQYAATYDHLQIRYAARTDRTTFANDVVNISFNTDTTNYNAHILFGGGTSGIEAGVISGQNFGVSGIGNATTSIGSSGNFGSGVIDILDAYSNKNKTVKCLSGYHHSNTSVATYSAVRVSLASLLWINTQQVSTIVLRPALSSNFSTGTRFSIYGIKG